MKNAITWFDLPTLDFERAVKFDSEILGEKIKVDDSMGAKMGFFPMDDMENMEGVGGDIVLPRPDFKPSDQGTHVYLNCTGKLDTVLSRVEKAGGKIVKAKFDIGSPGWIAMIKDTEGNVIGLHSPK